MTCDLSRLEDDLAAAESRVPHLRQGCAKAITWAGQSATRTDWAVIYLHGFSASGAELRPLPETVAKALGANLFATRLTGHGANGAAMAQATLADWRGDVDQALAIGSAIGQRLLIIGCSTGCTLAADALARGQGDGVAGCCFISPNFGLRNRLGQVLLDLPAADRWVPGLIGRERHFPVRSPAHAQFWTTRYPTRAVRPMADAVRAVRQADLGRVAAPLLMAINPRDQVIDPRAATRVLRRWGGSTKTIRLTQGPDDDPMGHVMAGDVFSPGQTRPLAAQIVAWAKNL